MKKKNFWATQKKGNNITSKFYRYKALLVTSVLQSHQIHMAARTPIPSPSLPLLPGRGGTTTVSRLTPVTRAGSRSVLRVYAAAAAGGGGESGRQRAPPGVDTRIHWENEDEGWVGGGTSSGTTTRSVEEEQKKNLLGEKFSELLNNSSDSHYQLVSSILSLK